MRRPSPAQSSVIPANQGASAPTNEHAIMLTEDRLFRRSDPDFPTTRIMQKRLVAAGRVGGGGTARSRAPPPPHQFRRSGAGGRVEETDTDGKTPAPRRSVHPLGETERGTDRPFREDEDRAIHLAQVRGLSLTDLSDALRRDVAVVSKHAIPLGVWFSVRTVRVPEGPRKGRLEWTLASILALGESTAWRREPWTLPSPAGEIRDPSRSQRLCARVRQRSAPLRSRRRTYRTRSAS